MWIDDELTIQRYKDLLFNMHHDMKGMEDEIKELKLKLKKKACLECEERKVKYVNIVVFLVIVLTLVILRVCYF